DLVGPGDGVVEPALLSYPRIAYPAAARQQQIAGKVVVLTLVDEEGAVTEAKLQQGVTSRYGVNEAVLAAIRRAKFRPATKNGIPVKMWRTIVVDVRAGRRAPVDSRQAAGGRRARVNARLSTRHPQLS